MSTSISETELQRSLPDILDRVAQDHESFVIERMGETVAKLEPAAERPKVTFRELAELLSELRTDDPAFADDLEAIQRAQPTVSFEPWPDW